MIWVIKLGPDLLFDIHDPAGAMHHVRVLYTCESLPSFHLQRHSQRFIVTIFMASAIKIRTYLFDYIVCCTAVGTAANAW